MCITLLTTKSTVYSQTILNDSLKCFTYEQARQIITDLRQLPIKDSIIKKLDSIIYVDSCVIEIQAKKVENQTTELIDKRAKILRMKKNRKLFFIFGAILGVSTQVLF